MTHKELALYWKFTEIKEWCQLKFKVPVICGGISFGDKRIKCLQALAWWVTDFTLWEKYIDLNNFKNIALYDTIYDSWINCEGTRDGKGGLIKRKEFLHEKWNQCEDIIYKKIYNHGKTVVVCPYNMSSEKVHQVLSTEKTGMCISSTNIFSANMFTI